MYHREHNMGYCFLFLIKDIDRLPLRLIKTVQFQPLVRHVCFMAVAIELVIFMKAAETAKNQELAHSTLSHVENSLKAWPSGIPTLGTRSSLLK